MYYKKALLEISVRPFCCKKMNKVKWKLSLMTEKSNSELKPKPNAALNYLWILTTKEKKGATERILRIRNLSLTLHGFLTLLYPNTDEGYRRRLQRGGNAEVRFSALTKKEDQYPCLLHDAFTASLSDQVCFSGLAAGYRTELLTAQQNTNCMTDPLQLKGDGGLTITVLPAFGAAPAKTASGFWFLLSWSKYTDITFFFYEAWKWSIFFESFYVAMCAICSVLPCWRNKAAADISNTL